MRVIVSSSLAIALLGGGCADDPDVSYSLLTAPRAQMKLKKADATLTHTSTTSWMLDKVGSVGVSSVSWQATATQGTTTSGLLIFNGIFRVENKGNAGATIGNIVVNLQTKVNNKWVTRSSVIADATQDDAATTAFVSPKGSSEGRSSFTETASSGSLLFTDATTNSTFALVPQVTIAPKAVQKLLFSATFDNNILGIPTGTDVRAEIIVSFGNAKASGNASPTVDINGNGIIDSDEAWVQSVAGRVTTTVPAQQPSNDTVELVDRVEDITTTGTVTFTNPQIVINGTTAFVTVDYNGGAEGGTITNCAHLTSTGQTSIVELDEFPNVQPIDLTACSTLVIGPHTCTPGTVGCGWEAGDVVTYNQVNWGDATTTAGVLLVDQYNTVYFSSFGQLEVGIPGTGGFSMTFTDPGSVLAYQPSVGTVGPLNADLLNPTSSASGAFGGEVVALELNIDFADADVLGDEIKFGDLTLCGFTAQPALDGMSVRDFAAAANTALGGGAQLYPILDLFTIAEQLNSAFESGAPSLFAQDHVFNGPCP